MSLFGDLGMLTGGGDLALAAFNPAAFGGSAGDSWCAACISLRPASGQTISFVGSVIAGQAGSTSDLGAMSINGTLTGGSNNAPSAGDLVIFFYATGSVTNGALAVSSPSGFTTDVDLFGNAANGTNLSVFHKFMPGSPDTSITPGPTGNVNDAGAYGAFVFRNVDSSSPIDATIATTETGTAGTPDPPNIIPGSTGSFIFVVGAAAADSFASDFTSSDLSGFRARREADFTDVSIGAGYKAT